MNEMMMMRKIAAANAKFDKERGRPMDISRMKGGSDWVPESFLKDSGNGISLDLTLQAPGADSSDDDKRIQAVDYFIKEVQKDALSEYRPQNGDKQSVDLNRNNSV